MVLLLWDHCSIQKNCIFTPSPSATKWKTPSPNPNHGSCSLLRHVFFFEQDSHPFCPFLTRYWSNHHLRMVSMKLKLLYVSEVVLHSNHRGSSRVTILKMDPKPGKLNIYIAKHGKWTPTGRCRNPTWKWMSPWGFSSLPAMWFLTPNGGLELQFGPF